MDDGRVGVIADEIGHDSNITYWEHVWLGGKNFSRGKQLNMFHCILNGEQTEIVWLFFQ